MKEEEEERNGSWGGRKKRWIEIIRRTIKGGLEDQEFLF